MKKMLAVLAVLVACCVFGQSQGFAKEEQEPMTIKLSIPDPIKSSVGTMAKFFADRVEEDTGGLIKVKIFASGILFGGDQNSAINMLQDGSLDALILSSSVYASFEPKMNAISLPYLFANYSEFVKYLEGKPGQSLLDSLSRLNIKGLSLAIRTYRNVTNSKLPITKPDDFKGLKIRVPNNKLWVDFFGALGANPTPMNFKEVYTALQLKTIDAQENPVEVPLANKFYEVQEYLSMTNHIADSFIIAFNNDVWEKITPEYQRIIKNDAVESARYKNSYDIKQEEIIVEKLKNNGMKVNRLTPEEIAVFQSEAVKLYPKFESMVGADFIKESLEFLGR